MNIPEPVRESYVLVEDGYVVYTVHVGAFTYEVSFYDDNREPLVVSADGWIPAASDEAEAYEAAALEACYRSDADDEIDDGMDGDAESALASAGWGTSEDYGDFGERFDDGSDFDGAF